MRQNVVRAGNTKTGGVRCALRFILVRGVDSSAISILMSHLRSEPVDVFSVGIKWLDRYNEFSYSRMVASEIGAVPHETMIGEDEFALFLEKLSWHADDPNGDPVCFPLFF